MDYILPAFFIPLGILGFSRPILLLYLFMAIPVLQFIPKAFGDFETVKLFKVGPVLITLYDYLVLLLALFFCKKFAVNAVYSC